MNWKGTAALVAVSLGLGAYAYFVEAKKDAPASTDSQEVKLWDVKADKSINHLVIVDAAGKKAEYLKKSEADGWRFAPKATDSLETFSWDSPYGNLATLTADRKVEDAPKDIAGYGLDKPTLKLLLGDRTKPDRYQVLIGSKNPLDGTSYYFRVNQDPAVYQIGSWKVDAWTKLVSAPPVAKPTPMPSPSATASALPAQKR